MLIRFLQDFTAKTASGSRLIAAGTELDLVPAKAGALIRAGIAELIGRDPPAIFSPAGDLLAGHVVTIRAAGGELLHMTDDPKERQRLEAAGLIVLTSPEAVALPIDPEAARAVLAIKAAFIGAVILETRPYKEGPSNGEEEQRKRTDSARAMRLSGRATGRPAPSNQDPDKRAGEG